METTHVNQGGDAYAQGGETRWLLMINVQIAPVSPSPRLPVSLPRPLPCRCAPSELHATVRSGCRVHHLIPKQPNKCVALDLPSRTVPHVPPPHLSLSLSRALSLPPQSGRQGRDRRARKSAAVGVPRAAAAAGEHGCGCGCGGGGGCGGGRSADPGRPGPTHDKGDPRRGMMTQRSHPWCMYCFIWRTQQWEDVIVC